MLGFFFFLDWELPGFHHTATMHIQVLDCVSWEMSASQGTSIETFFSKTSPYQHLPLVQKLLTLSWFAAGNICSV